ncbi:MAG: sulfite exporter TauE/SafE family protein [Nanoarchaeota archaeon]|nr:sulfite exporter TauE/SafE family protein [Nanoarchaeota archaeon]
MKKLNLKVQGMTCSSCEVLIERNLKKIPGVEKVKVSRAKEQAEVECADNVNMQQLQDAVKEKGYILSLQESNHDQNNSTNPFILKDKERYSEIGAVLVVLFAGYFLLTQFDLLPKNFGVTDNMSYGFIFVIGLVAATSTCLAVAGGLLLAVSSKFNERNQHLQGWHKFKPHLYFNAGRIASYTILGGAIGALGSVLTISSGVTGIIVIIASLLMIVMGLQLLGIFPWLNKIQIKMPKFIAHKLYDTSHQGQKPASKTSSFLFGAATFLLPCGFTQALQLYVLGKGSFMVGALTMLAFSLGTLPSLAGIGAFSSFTKGNVKRYFMTFSAVLVIVLGIVNLTPGFNLVGAAVALPSIDNSIDTNINSNVVGEKQIIDLKVDGLDYFPDKFTIKKGVPVEWNIDGKNAQGCAGIISVPKLGITERLPKDSIKTITFTPQQTGKITFTCGMGMAGPGTFEVVP